MADRKKAKRMAEELIAKYAINFPVVNVFDLARREGISIEYRKFNDDDQDVAGFLVEENKTIYLNVNDIPTRQAFTAAHELGHHFMQHSPDAYAVYRKDTFGKEKTAEEKEADYFAANLLMPEQMLVDEMKRLGLSEEAVSALALRFGVSPSAMKYRLQEVK
jgi:Zn-dependent peptidase ImmA (M78 family)